MEEAADITEKKERGRVDDQESSLTKVYDISKNPIFYFQEAIRAILNCLGFESSKPESSSSSMSDKKEEENNKEDSSEQEEEDDPEGKQASTDNNNDNPNTPSADDPPQSQTLIEAATRRGRTPPRPGVSRGSPPQNN
ncbi:uncharacterized protein LOC107801243 [Nicotiana tabacum]|uniref:Uncharacterized protein LOC107801243 n=2 Tax=Nicotiana TaxID=4085 RepID=A0A1S4AU39_TOBAC|nr:PREDICTED: uncharacterized protein LOC104248345 [Nicotiana sylvestris]XP_016480013.1 PREDICTED: uncharacterized protein LOC107801243 [Nicotiana tabacum]